LAGRRPSPAAPAAAVRAEALADTLSGLPRGVSVGFVDTLEDVDDGPAYCRLRGRFSL